MADPEQKHRTVRVLELLTAPRSWTEGYRDRHEEAADD